MYSRIHCFARMLKSADARLNMRLSSQKQLIRIVDASGVKGFKSEEMAAVCDTFGC